MSNLQGPGRGASPPLAHDDYCRLIGQITLDAHIRIRSLEAQLAGVAAGFRAEGDRLRGEIAGLRAAPDGHTRTPPAPPATDDDSLRGPPYGSLGA